MMRYFSNAVWICKKKERQSGSFIGIAGIARVLRHIVGAYIGYITIGYDCVVGCVLPGLVCLDVAVAGVQLACGGEGPSLGPCGAPGV